MSSKKGPIIIAAIIIAIIACTIVKAVFFPTPQNPYSEKNYVGNVNNHKLHSINCTQLPYEENRVYFSTIEAAYAAGYTDKHYECMGQ